MLQVQCWWSNGIIFWQEHTWKIGGYIMVKQTGQSRRSCMLLVDCFPGFPVEGVAAFLKGEPLNSALEVAGWPVSWSKYAMRDSISSLLMMPPGAIVLFPSIVNASKTVSLSKSGTQFYLPSIVYPDKHN